ncbi:hydrocephalus-inducing protein homolog [Melopsittacus undulatus]|uniref:hydrocephalus-inducing protein homolog n=1 Tax=Melopsittacus undulatus TaxID=13146 RepID=UPI00146F8632|nr:hydrocephalus-inducing protein homolog [Melopsittacus undulatus]
MASGKTPRPMRSSRRADGFQSRVVASRNPKLVREAEESLSSKQRLARPREMRQPRTAQLRDMGEVSHQKFSAVERDQRSFQPFPSEVVFENYIPHQFYIASLALRNKDRVPRLLNVILGNSPYFELISPSDEDYKVAPGTSSTYRILFRPDENKDYFEELIIITEREKFFVPIRAIGARASLDFPEQLNFSECPVRFSTQKTLLVRNVGKREACYSITTLSPFSVDPSIGTLGVGEAMQVTVEFHPPKTGVYTSPMIVHYDTGEDVHKSLCGTAVNADIRLDKSSLTVEKTSLTLSKQSSLVIHNQSGITAHFQWKRFVDEEEEERQKLRLQRQEEDKLVDVPKEHGVVPPLREHPSLPVCTSQSQGTEVQGDSTPFCSDIFTIVPMEGDILPNSSLEINVIFKPKEARVYQEAAYCDISGCETRLPLCISGEGVGPQVELSCDQVLLLNRGVPEAPFSVVYPERALDSCYEVALRGEASGISYLLDTTEIDCGLQVFNKVSEAAVTLQNSGKLGFAFVVLSPGTGTAASPLPGVPLVVPSMGYIEPGKQQVLKVYYLPGVPGVFCRAFQIQVGHLEPAKICLKGEGTFPRIHLDLPRNIKGNAKYEKILQKAQEKLDKGSQRDEAIALGEAVAAEPRMDDSGTMWDAQLQMQMEEMLMEEHAVEQQKALSSRPPEDTAFHQRVHRRLLKAELPEYILDLGYVVPGDIHTHMVKITNTRHFPASFRVDGYVLYNTGFSVCLERVKRLPSCESKTFEVCFDPQSANVPLGKVDVLLPIKKCYRGELQIQICQSSQRLQPLQTPKDDNSPNSLLLPPCAPGEKLTGEVQGGLKQAGGLLPWGLLDLPPPGPALPPQTLFNVFVSDTDNGIEHPQQVC